MILPEVDAERLALVRDRLFTPVVGDVLDQLGRTHQFLPQAIQALRPDMVLVGRAMPVLITDVFEAQGSPFGRLTEALDQLEPGEVYLVRPSAGCVTTRLNFVAPATTARACASCASSMNNSIHTVVQPTVPDTGAPRLGVS